MRSEIPKDVSCNCDERRGQGESRGDETVCIDSNEDGDEDCEGREVLNYMCG